MEARIISISDAFDAMTSDRHYRKSRGVEAAAEEIRNNKGTQFDAQIADVFLKLVREIGNGDLDRYFN